MFCFSVDHHPFLCDHPNDYIFPGYVCNYWLVLAVIFYVSAEIWSGIWNSGLRLDLVMFAEDCPLEI